MAKQTNIGTFVQNFVPMNLIQSFINELVKWDHSVSVSNLLGAYYDIDVLENILQSVEDQN